MKGTLVWVPFCLQYNVDKSNPNQFLSQQWNACLLSISCALTFKNPIYFGADSWCCHETVSFLHTLMPGWGNPYSWHSGTRLVL